MKEHLNILAPGSWITTPRANVDLADPKAEDIHLTDMAIALSRIPRYNGLSSDASPIYVAQHLLCCNDLAEMAGITEPSVRLMILLHDGHEYVLGDIGRPVKTLIGHVLEPLERAVDRAICEHFDLPVEYARGADSPIYDAIKYFDNLALAHEVDGRFPEAKRQWKNLPELKIPSMFGDQGPKWSKSRGMARWSFMIEVKHWHNKVLKQRGAANAQ